MKKFVVYVTETYETRYEIEAEDSEEAYDIAETLAEDDTEITSPENMTDREIDVHDDEEEQ